MNTRISKYLQLLEHLHVIFFFCFLLTWPLSVRKVLYMEPIMGRFNEYSSIFIYLSDIFLLLAISCYGILILYNNYFNKSSKIEMFHVEHFSKSFVKSTITLFIPTLFILLVGISISYGENTEIGAFRFLKHLEFYALFLYLYSNVPRGTFLKDTLKVIILSGTFHGLIAIAQFFAQESLGFIWLKESIISAYLPDVAKIDFMQAKIVRAYGLFPHPNVLGGFLLFSSIVTVLFFKLFHVEQFKKRIVPRGTILLSVQLIALFFTFSRSAWLGLGFVLMYLLIISLKNTFVNNQIVPRGTIYAILGLVALPLIFASGISKFGNWESFVVQPLAERKLFVDVSRGTITNNLLTGVGIGNFVLSERENATIDAPWKYQPVHNFFLLLLSEVGIVALGLMLWFLYLMFHVEHSAEFKLLILALIPILMLDHYLWDIQQGQIIFWMSAALILTKR